MLDEGPGAVTTGGSVVLDVATVTTGCVSGGLVGVTGMAYLEDLLASLESGGLVGVT